MTTSIDPTIRGKAQHFGVDAALIQAVYQAEGGTPAALIRAVQCSLPSVSTFEEAVDIVCRSAVHALCDFFGTENRDAFAMFWGKRWAPRGALNDPGNLNANWPRNVARIWTQLRPLPDVHV